MKRITIIFFALFAFLFPSILLSQDQDTNHLGIGVSFDPSKVGHITIYSFDPNPSVTSIVNKTPIIFYLPININNQFRIEPMFGLSSINSEYDQSSKVDTNSDFSNTKNTYTVASTTIGFGGFYISSLSNYFNLYFGPRLYFTFLSYSNESKYEQSYNNHYSSNDMKTESKELDITIGLSVGAEYFLYRKFSLGAEASLDYTSYGNPDVTNTPQQTAPYFITSNDRTQYSYNTSGIFFVRWYFI